MSSTVNTLKSLIEEHARLDFSDFLSILHAIFHAVRLLIYSVNKQIFSKPACLFRSACLLGTSEYVASFRSYLVTMLKRP